MVYLRSSGSSRTTLTRSPPTTIWYQLSPSEFVTLRIYDALGKEVRTLVSKVQRAGGYEAKFNAGGLPSGVYFYRLEATSLTESTKLPLLT